jgi:glycine hydroxymethyltransferase
MDQVLELIEKEEKRQKETLMMIASENYTYPEVRTALGSFLGHKYSEGYPGKRYYQGNRFIDQIENIAIERAKKLFDVEHVNVQPYSGSPANGAVYMALLQTGETIMGMALSAGGHLTHGHPKITFSGKFFNSAQYGVNKGGCLDYEEIEKLALEYNPKLIIAGHSAYPRIIDWEKFEEIADKVGAILMADISHIAGLIAGGVHPSPNKYAHVITTTTHKTLCGPRGAIIMVTKNGLELDPDMGKKIDRAVFPGLQGGPHNNQTAGIAIALERANGEEFKKYAKVVVENAKILSDELVKRNFVLVSGGTENHLMLVDLRNLNISGNDAAVKLEEAGIIVNSNAIPFDTNPPTNPSGIRIGTAALSARGMGETEMILIAEWIEGSLKGDGKRRIEICEEVKELCERFPVE